MPLWDDPGDGFSSTAWVDMAKSDENTATSSIVQPSAVSLASDHRLKASFIRSPTKGLRSRDACCQLDCVPVNLPTYSSVHQYPSSLWRATHTPPSSPLAKAYRCQKVRVAEVIPVRSIIGDQRITFWSFRYLPPGLSVQAYVPLREEAVVRAQGEPLEQSSGPQVDSVQSSVPLSISSSNTVSLAPA